MLYFLFGFRKKFEKTSKNVFVLTMWQINNKSSCESPLISTYILISKYRKIFIEGTLHLQRFVETKRKMVRENL